MYLYVLDDGTIYQTREKPLQDEIDAVKDGCLRIFTIQACTFVEVQSTQFPGEKASMTYIGLPTRQQLGLEVVKC